ncbi:hypothetical protein [Robiginitomaculum antarcticum]|uniref:hypothetical protein n=1 Tax=Robiginitomaculum antarcticum TaxID=437507 RepID=UPI0003656ACE|nr:hypothetical protein [Robiginitomaculum antarcticum]
MRFAVIALSASLLGLSAPSVAQISAPTPEVLTQLYKCKELTNDGARLACYDAGVGLVEQAQETGDLVAIDREAAEGIKRDSFGFNIPSLPKLGFPSFGGDDDAKDDVTIVAITRTKTKARGDYIFYTENGQVWEQVDGRSLRRAPRGNDNQLHIRKAAIGSFLAQVNGTGPGIRVRRVE